MMKRRSLITLATLLALLLVVSSLARAAEEPARKAEAKTEEAVKKADFLFVQNAHSIHYADGKLILKGVSPITIMFSDRPERIAGHMTTARFVPFWSNGKDSFLSDPPNATLSVVDDDKVSDVVVELRDPALKGDELSYNVRVLEGEMPTQGGPVSLFIDIIPANMDLKDLKVGDQVVAHYVQELGIAVGPAPTPSLNLPKVGNE